MAAMQAAFGDPEVLLGAVRSQEQIEMEPLLDTAVAVTIGVIDWVVDAVAVRVIGGNALQIAEAARRRRAETTPDDIFVERLLGIRLGNEQTARGQAVRPGRRRPRRRDTASSRCSPRLRPCRRRTRSRRLASGSPA